MSAAIVPWILSEGLAGLQAQALGLAEASGVEGGDEGVETGGALEMVYRAILA